LSSKFKYKKGSSYSYKYDSQTNVQLVGNSKNVATVGLKADVLLSVIDTCEFVLKISGAALSGPSAAQIGFDLVKDLEKFPLAFSFDNGAVRDICPSKDDTVEALNIKRAILSSFQIANDFDAEVSYESDISGHCPARQTLQGSGGTISVTKTKNLLECRDHFHFYSSVRMVPYHVRSHVQNPPTYKASQECKFNIQNNVLRDSSCKENHDYVPFRNEKSGAGVSITVTSKLAFSQEGKASGAARLEITFFSMLGARQVTLASLLIFRRKLRLFSFKSLELTPTIVERQSLLYDDQNIPWRESKNGITTARETLQILCKTASNDVRPDTASHFVEFVHELKTTTLEDLRILAKETKNPPAQCKKFRQFVLDGIAQCGTTACVSLLTELLTKKSDYASLSQMEEKFALGNLALTARPTKAMITSLTGVLENLPRNGLFATTALVNNYCRLHKKCQEKPEVKSFVQKYVSLVSRLQLSDKGPENIKAVETLRAFGNLGSFADGIKERLSFLDKSAHIDAKLAAVQSLRRAPCTNDLEEKLFIKFVDNEEDTEVRINAFLVLMHQCADKELISRIVNSSDKINSNQVGSFVQSYFANTRASVDPSKNKPAFARAHLSKRFPSDPRKHSRHFHYSNFNYDYNLGSHADAFVLYEPEFTFPKQASINLTIDYFGNEINLLEFGVRAENFDRVYDSFFGPEGYLTNPKAAYNKENRKIAVKNPRVAEFQSLYDKEHKRSEDLDFGAYMRVFGDELFYSSAYNVPISELMGKFTPEKIVKTLGKEKVRTIAIHRLPFDHHATVPVISGFPLRYDGNVTVVINLDLADMVNIGDLPNGNAEVKLTFKPSANVETAVIFGIYTGAVKNGVRISRSSHTSTALEFALKLSNRDNVVAKLNLPKERQELAKVNGKIETIINNVPIEEKGVVTNRGEGSVCSPKKLGERIGLKLCTVISYPNASDVVDAPYFPLTGPFNAEVYIDKADPGVSSYELAASWKATKDGRDVIFSIDTPKSQMNRKISLTSKYIRQKSLDLEYKSPKRIITAKGVMEGAGPDNTAATFNIGVDGKVYEVKANVIRSTSPDGAQKYQVTGNVKSPDKPSVGDLKGTFDITPGSKFVADASLTKLFDKPITYKEKNEKKFINYNLLLRLGAMAIYP
uniref:Vitellogenin domain-containing protein n=1 Tax=Romanomermis culicivorax TaxID=13658 RepID=A0A915L5G5_ROMCU